MQPASPASSPPSPAKSPSASVHQAHRVRMSTLNVGKVDRLEFVHRRIADEAPRVAACCLKIWERDGKIPSQAGK